MDKEKLNNSNVIRNISTDQTEILHNIMTLYTDGKAFDCDMTASKLKFYNNDRCKYQIPEPSILFDVFPQMVKIKKIEPLGKLPLEEGVLESIVIDLPFVIAPKDSASTRNPNKRSNIIFNRFSSYYPLDDLYESYFHWISEAYRVLKPNGLCVFKCQSTVTGGVQANSEEFSFMCAQKVGFTVEDKFILAAKSRLISSSKINNQQHARKYTSVFYCFKKTIKKKSKNFNYFDLIDVLSVNEKNR